MKECVTLQFCWVCWTKVQWYNMVTSKRAGQREWPQRSCHKILLILCTVSHLLLFKKKKERKKRKWTVAFVFAFWGCKCHIPVNGPLYWSMIYRLFICMTLVLTISLVRNTEIQGYVWSPRGYWKQCKISSCVTLNSALFKRVTYWVL